MTTTRLKVSPKYINSLSELITSNIDLVAPMDSHSALRTDMKERQAAAVDIFKVSRAMRVVANDSVVKLLNVPKQQHFRNTLNCMDSRRTNPTADARTLEWDSIDLQPALSRLNHIQGV